MNGSDDRFSKWLSAHPREALQIALIGACFIWQPLVSILGLIIFLITVRCLKLPWWTVLICGVMIALLALISQHQQGTSFLPSQIIAEGFSSTIIFWKLLFHENFNSALRFIYLEDFNYILGFPLLVAGILGVLELISGSPHDRALKALFRGEHSLAFELNDKRLNKAMRNLNEESVDGALLGISKRTGQPLVIPDLSINQIVLVLGTTGGGKTITLRRFYQRAARRGYPLIVVDGKPTDENVLWLQNLAKYYQRSFYGFNCGNYLHYDPLAKGGFTELKDKIISLKDQWESDYYRSIAEDYLQTTFEVLLKRGEPFDLKTVVECLDYPTLAVFARMTKDEQLMTRVKRLESYDHKDITGLQAHLNLLIHSELGQFFQKNETMFSLSQVIETNGIVYFALPALRFPTFSKVLGKLIINDIKATIDRPKDIKPVFTVFDEFSVFAGEQVLNLVNMGRGKGVHAIFGTQGLADLKAVSPTFESQVLNCANTLICHRLNDGESAEKVAMWIGTQNTFDVSAQISSEQGSAGGMGNVKSNKMFIVHPDDIKQSLQAGEAFYATKIGKFQPDKIKVKFS